MKVNRKQVKKRMAFMLLLALLVTMVQPISSYADEPEKEAETMNPDAGEVEKGDLDVNAVESDSDADNRKASDQEPVEKHSGQPEERAGNSDTDTPVIEEIVFEQNHTTVARDAKISLSVYVYDASAIKDIDAQISVENADRSCAMEWKKGSNEKEYICTYQLDGKTSGRLLINSISITDEYGNQAVKYMYGEPEGYWVDIEEALEDKAMYVKSFEFLENGQTVDYMSFQSMSMKLETQEAIEEQSVWLRFMTEGKENYFEAELSASGSEPVHTVFDSLSGSCSYNLASGKYNLTLQEVYIKQGDFEVGIPLVMENKEDYGFTLSMEEEEKDTIVITSVEIDKKGEIVREGDEINITIGAEIGNGKELPSTGSVDFTPAAQNIDSVERSVNVELSEKDNKYHGALKIEDMYPCEWYISRIDIGNSLYSTEDGAYTDEAGYPCYVRVYNGESFVNPEFEVNINFMALDENGEYRSVSTVTKNVQRRQTLNEIGVTFPEMRSDYPGVTQLGWIDRNGVEITGESSVLDEHMIVYARYDKGIFNASYRYPNNAGGWSSVSQPIIYEQGETYGNLLKKAEGFMPEDLVKEYPFSNWEYELYYGEDEVVSGVAGNYFIANFSGIIALEVYRDYFDERGSRYLESSSGEFLAVKEGKKSRDVIKMLNESESPNTYKGLRFKEWESYAHVGNMDEVAENGQVFIMQATYENCLVRYIINGSRLLGESEGENIFCQVAEKGETVNALTSFEGFGEVTWDVDAAPDKTFVVNDHMTFWGSADEGNPVNPAKPSKPSGGSTSASGNKPDETLAGELPDSVVNSIIKEVNNAAQGENIKVNMGSKTVVSKDILEAARGKDVSVTLEMEGYSWTINGKDIMAANLQDIDFKVIKHTDHIPDSTVKALAGDNPCMQITLVHEGSFGFKATLTIGVGTEYAGKYGNLYYHDSVGKMVFINAGQINAEGDVSLVFSHASDYLLVVSDRVMSQVDVPDRLMPTGAAQNQNGNTSAPDGNVRRSAKTGDYSMISLWILLCAAATGAVVYSFGKKRI